VSRNAIVLDASVALAWFIDRDPERKSYAYNVVMAFARGEIEFHVPDLFFTEVANGLLKAHRNKERRFTRDMLNEAVEYLDKSVNDIHALGMDVLQSVERAVQYNLQAYDTVYFDLARTMEYPIATLDKGIRSACERFNVELFTPTDVA
jgi:predicted nucleic acid-binding protein